jgi:hypothetical protein
MFIAGPQTTSLGLFFGGAATMISGSSNLRTAAPPKNKNNGRWRASYKHATPTGFGRTPTDPVTTVTKAQRKCLPQDSFVSFVCFCGQVHCRVCLIPRPSI